MAQKPGPGRTPGSQEDEVAVEDEAESTGSGPGEWAVILLNDDYTTMEFVIEVLSKFFKKTEAEAMAIMLKVHHEGRGVAGIYSKEIAETKTAQVNEYSQSKGHPLKCIFEEVKT